MLEEVAALLGRLYWPRRRLPASGPPLMWRRRQREPQQVRLPRHRQQRPHRQLRRLLRRFQWQRSVAWRSPPRIVLGRLRQG